MNNSLFRSILQTVQKRNLPNHFTPTAPRFDPSAPCSPGSITDYSQRISSFGLPATLASDVIATVAQESQQYQAFVNQVRLRLLAELSTSTVTPDASTIPSLVEAACDSFQNLLIDSGLEVIQRITSEEPFDNVESDGQSITDSDAGSATGSDSDHDGDEELFDPCEEDDNAPIKPGEDVPPLETKYLPIFEALHERGKVLTKPEKTYLVNMTGMTYRQITIWFQNRRRGELKESMNINTSYSRASSTHSDELSESEQELEKHLGAYPPSTTFDIRSWRLQSALATKDDNRGSIPPLSPFKHNFPFSLDPSNSESDTELSDDSDDDVCVPPGLQAPSLTTSVTTFDSISVNSTSGNMAGNTAFQSSAISGESFFTPKEGVHTRPIKDLPSLRRGSPAALPLQTQHKYSQHISSSNTISQRLSSRSSQSSDIAPTPSQCISSNDSGLTINLDATAQLQTSTLMSSPVSASLDPPNSFAPGPSRIPISPPPTSARSQHHASPPSSASPRPNIKPLPRRTGCAPRPRPPPRSGSSIPTVASMTAPGPSRPSVVLPPSSNPSLGNTTLGALLRPNPPGPAIPQEIEERLTAMARRMGVGSLSIPSNALSEEVSENSAASSRGTLLSFGPTSLPRTNVSPRVQLVPEQTQGPTVPSPPSL